MLENPSIFGYPFDWFEDLLRLGIFFGVVVFLLRYRHWKSQGILLSVLFLAGIMLLGGFGARGMEAIESILTGGQAAAQYSFWEMVGGKGGRRFYGALFINFIAIYFIIKISGKTRLLGLVDELMIAVSGGLVFGKIGCFMSGHGCHGVPTNLPWGVRVTHGSVPSILPVHPAPIYDAIVYAILFIVLLRLTNNKKYDGQLTIIFLFVASITSILIGTIRTDDPVIFNMTLAQIVYTFLLIATIVFYRNRNRNLGQREFGNLEIR